MLYRRGNYFPDSFRCRDEVVVREVRVAGSGPMPPVPEQPADHRQVLPGHDGMTGCGVAEIVKAQSAKLGILANTPPACGEAVCTPALGISGEQEGVTAPRS